MSDHNSSNVLSPGGMPDDSPLVPALYLIPVGMSDAPHEAVLPQGNMRILRSLRYFVVENVRSARRFIKKYYPEADIQAMTFYELNRLTPPEEVGRMLDPLRRGLPMGVMSDAGCPAVADPGAIVVAAAQRENLRVVPLVGPSSILMALMASGFNGQGFAFHGYLPIDDDQKGALLQRLENDSRRYGMTQIFIETPYRNSRLLSFLLSRLNPSTMLCVACDLTSPTSESVRSMPVADWQRLAATSSLENYDKRPAIFLIYAGDREEVHQRKPHMTKKGKHNFHPL